MFQWLLIGFVIWYFYRQYKKRQYREIGRRNTYLRNERMRNDFNSPRSQPANEDEYIDYEEIK